MPWEPLFVRVGYCMRQGVSETPFGERTTAPSLFGRGGGVTGHGLTRICNLQLLLLNLHPAVAPYCDCWPRFDDKVRRGSKDGGAGGGAYGFIAMGARARRESRVGSTPLGGRCKVIRKTGGKA